MTVGREIEIGDDHLRPFRVVERARDPNQTGRDIRLDRYLVDRRAKHGREVLAERFVLADPMVVPGPSPQVCPLREETLDPFAPAARQRCERATIQIVEALGDRELRAPGALLGFHHQPAA
jgi:hypothetical protein